MAESLPMTKKKVNISKQDKSEKEYSLPTTTRNDNNLRNRFLTEDQTDYARHDEKLFKDKDLNYAEKAIIKDSSFDKAIIRF